MMKKLLHGVTRICFSSMISYLPFAEGQRTDRLPKKSMTIVHLHTEYINWSIDRSRGAFNICRPPNPENVRTLDRAPCVCASMERRTSHSSLSDSKCGRHTASKRWPSDRNCLDVAGTKFVLRIVAVAKTWANIAHGRGAPYWIGRQKCRPVCH